MSSAAVAPGWTDPGSGVSVSLRMLVTIRWVAIGGQAAALFVVSHLFGLAVPIMAAFAVVATSALLNLTILLPRPAVARLGGRAAAFFLAYDIMQLGMLLFLTGGVENPFAILMLAPVTVAATVLSRRSVIWLSTLTIAGLTLLTAFHLPLPWWEPALVFPPLYAVGIWAALVTATAFLSGYIWSVAEEARRMRDAFAATQLALAREQRVSAVGALAAAAAHELGSPLATIAVVAKELVRDLPADSPYAEDAALLLSQSERCRRILANLSRHRDSEGGTPFTLLPISALVEAAGEPYEAAGVRVIFSTASDRNGPERAGTEPLVARSPEILHGLGNLIQNAVQFARHEVSVTTAWDGETVAVDVADDGPGFPATVLARIGEPYISGREGETQHMGLGIFIAQSLLERTGARLVFDNLPEGGAQVTVEWPRARLEAKAELSPVEETGA